ncbi:MAG: hypothetical protein M1833_000128 [Piccolia ochrophora]|nr:MAG: hypothetical protein M1833_000128 [Piccolia ochrophora]
MSSTFNVAVVGYGLSAKVFHIPLILAVSTLRLYAIVQRHPKSDDDAATDFPNVRSCRSIEEVLADADVDVVVMTTIPDTHSTLAKLALQAGKHVIVEKPFTPTVEEADELIGLAKKQSRLLSVYQNRRWDSDFVTLSRLLEARKLGRVVEFETHFDRHRPDAPTSTGWKTKPLPGGGVVYDLGTHLIDQVVVCFGMPDRVTGFIGSQREGDTQGQEDSCTVLLHYQNGLMATIKAGVISPEVAQLRYWYHIDCQEDQLKAEMKPGDDQFGIESQDRHGILTLIEGDKPISETCPTVKPVTYVEYYRLFAQALAGNGEVPVKAEEARDVIKLVELARQSSKEQRTLDV